MSEVQWHKVSNYDKKDKVTGPTELKGMYALTLDSYREVLQQPEDSQVCAHHEMFSLLSVGHAWCCISTG